MPKDRDAHRLLSSKGLTRSSKITKTRAASEFQLDNRHFRNIRTAEVRENPHNPNYAPMQLYNAADVAQVALSVNPPSGQNEYVRSHREERRNDREDYTAYVQERNAYNASLVHARTPVERLCQEERLPYYQQVTKTTAMHKFNLEHYELEGLPYTELPNPHHPGFAPMKLYRAEDVAERAFDCGAFSESEYY